MRVRRVLVVDPDASRGESLRRLLRGHALDAIVVRAIADALARCDTYAPDLVVAEFDLPDGRAVDLCRGLRGRKPAADVPFIAVSSRDDEIDRVVSFEVGADDFVTRPFSPREFVLRVRAILRRAGHGWNESEGVALDSEAMLLRIGRLEIVLTPIETRLMERLLHAEIPVVPRERLLEDLWGVRGADKGRVLDATLKRVRAKLGGSAARLETVRGIGIRWRRD